MASIRTLRRNLCPSVTVLVAILGLAPGCAREDSLRPEKLAFDEHASGNNQSAMHGEALPFPFRAVVQGPDKRGWLGGKGSARAVPGVTVRVRTSSQMRLVWRRPDCVLGGVRAMSS